MQTNTKRQAPTQNHSKRQFTDSDRLDMAVLAKARRWLNANGLRQFDLHLEERARRAEIYRRQVEETGRIEYLPPAPDQQRTPRTSRFGHGDILRPHLAASAS